MCPNQASMYGAHNTSFYVPTNNTTKNTQSTSSMSNLSQDNSLMTMLSTLCSKVETLEKNMNLPYQGRGPNKNEQQLRNDTKLNPKTGRKWKRYCWSRDCCDHWGRNCPNRKQGHQIDATFKDRKGGSTENVLGA